jgi:predicted  nucleic acid-binding Zn-ribbon protein
MDISVIFNPVISPTILALAASGGVLFAIIKYMKRISQGMTQIKQKLFTRSGFFWTVNVVFMAVSVLHAGIFFGITGDGHATLPGMGQMLGFAVSFFLDLVTIILMQAMLEARYRGEELRVKQFLMFIIICCGTSTYANLAISLNDFEAAKMLPNAPQWIQVSSPWVLASFPLFVIMMSIAGELIVNVKPLESLDEADYEASEKKRVRVIQIRNTYLQQQANEQQRTLTIRAQMRAQRGHLPRSFRWPWEMMGESKTVHDLRQQLGSGQAEVSTLKQQMDTLRLELDTLRGQVTAKDRVITHKHGQVENAEQQVSTLQTQLSNGQQEMSTLREQLAGAIQELTSLRGQQAISEKRLEALQSSSTSGQEQVSTLYGQLEESRQEVSTLRLQLTTAQQRVSSLELSTESGQGEMDTLYGQVQELQAQLISRQQEVSRLKGEVSTKEREVSTLSRQLSTKEREVSTLREEMDTLKVSTTVHMDTPVDIKERDTEGLKIADLGAERARKSAKSMQELLPQARVLLQKDPTMSGRAIATRLGCSPTIGNKLKDTIMPRDAAAKELQPAAV